MSEVNETTDAAIERLEALQAKATPGPVTGVCGKIYLNLVNGKQIEQKVPEDYRFLLALRNEALPLLNRLRAEREDLRAQLKGPLALEVIVRNFLADFEHKATSDETPKELRRVAKMGVVLLQDLLQAVYGHD
ncbi:MAG: hypothetical protein CVV27_15320 [Candidatus Melainabacteria bacterium HGW-Melainabacteria-1]|nr:MAG: hypothetical protein CVV27_15320 [Candidatus Melainabacteria bacterium HGW-Melainabacteria-1]